MTPARSPWVCATWLADLLQHRPVTAGPQGEWRLLEVGCDAEHRYRAGHIPGADYIDTREVESLPLWNVLKPEQLRQVLLSHGLRAESTASFTAAAIMRRSGWRTFCYTPGSEMFAYWMAAGRAGCAPVSPGKPVQRQASTRNWILA
ncbi:hypothetical protein O3S68_03980 [Kosakonia sp. SOY2]|uniref:hypothetical protein n=1 Tax=Kosakonia sp. SOY2 TaxID=3014557 RepID=UPI0022AC6F32|nr:hypothetical protein [Kosakonia sp. SOY2]MCZ3381451.1 hypothetical protein [Kosakonia sp. SOY2]